MKLSCSWLLIAILAGIVLLALLAGALEADAGGLSSCYGITDRAGTVTRVGFATVTVSIGTLADTASSLRHWRTGDAVRVNGIICDGVLEITLLRK